MIDLLSIIFFSTGAILLLINLGIKNNTQFLIEKNNKECIKYKKQIDDAFIQNNLFVITFRDFQKNQYYKIGLVLLKLRNYHEQILKDLDPHHDHDFFNDIKYNIDQIDVSLREISFLTPGIAENVNTDFSIFDELLIEKSSNFFKN